DADPLSTATFLLMHAQEFHSSVWGHIGLLGLRSHYLLPEYAGYPNTAAASLGLTNAMVADLAHAQGALVGYVHPFDTKPDPADTTAPLWYELPVTAPPGKLTTSRSLDSRDISSPPRFGNGFSTAASGFRRPLAPVLFRISPV